MAATVKRLIYIFIIFFIILLSGGQAILPTYAATSDYSNVLTDLQRDENFNINDYKGTPDDYSINVIQVAESANGELFLYTYQPCQLTQFLVATDINMSLSESADGTKLYSLTLLSSSGVFCKYLVNGVTVSSADVRYYNVTSIYRAWNTKLDGESENDNTGNKKAYAVGTIYRATTENGKVNYYCSPTFVVNILNPYVDYLFYVKNSPYVPGSIPSISAGFQKWDIIDSHYVAFSTDWEIDKLISADVHYYYRTATGKYDMIFSFACNGDVTYGQEQETTATVNYSNKTAISGSGPYGNKNSYTWNEIQTVSEFLSTEENLTDETKQNLKGKQWILRFATTERTQRDISAVLGAYKHYETDFTQVDRVSILRLEFESSGTVYNLGAVSDEMNGDDKPGNANEEKKKSLWDYFVEFCKWLESLTGISYIVWMIIFAVVLLVLLYPILNILSPIIKGIFSVLWWIISAPFKLIAKIFTRDKE